MNLDNKISIYIVEDYLLIRKSLIHIINKAPEFNVIGDFENAEDFIEEFKDKPSDVVLMDLGLPKMNGLQATKLIKEISPDTKVIILTSHENIDEVIAALAIGANAYCLKEIESYLIHSIILSVHNGSLWLHPIIEDTAQSYLSKSVSFDIDKLYAGYNLNSYLNDLECSVLKAIIDGKSNVEIAKQFDVTDSTAKSHISSILHKLSLVDKIQSVINSSREKVVD